MATCDTIVQNDSGSQVELKLSNAGVHLKIKKIENGESYTIKSEPNATYREYWVGSVEGTPIVFSSDDCLENEKIIIQSGGTAQNIPRKHATSQKGLLARLGELVGFTN